MQGRIQDTPETERRSKRGTQSRPKHCTRPLYSTSRAGFGPFLALSLGHAAALAPVTILADALALGAAVPRGCGRRGFEYGWVRGTGSAAFIGGILLRGRP